jgi:hypothetical protein
MIRQTTSKYPAVWRIINGQNIDFRPELLSKRKIYAALISTSHQGRQLEGRMRAVRAVRAVSRAVKSSALLLTHS